MIKSRKVTTATTTDTPATATTANPVAATTGLPIADQLAAIEKTLASTRSLTRAERKSLETRSSSVPDALIEQMIQIAQKNGGLVAGMSFDAAAAKATLTQVSSAQAAAAASRTIAQKIENGWVQQRITLADRVFGIYQALGRIVRTPEGNSLLGTYGEMKTTVRNRPRKPRKKATAASSARPATKKGAAKATTAVAASPTATGSETAPPPPAVVAPPPPPAAATVTNGASHS